MLTYSVLYLKVIIGENLITKMHDIPILNRGQNAETVSKKFLINNDNLNFTS